MTRFTYTLVLAGSVLALAGCPGDDTTPGGATEGSTGTAGDDGGMTTPPTTSATTPMTEGPGDTTEDPTLDDTTDGDIPCDPPCLPGQDCIAGNCFGDPETTGPLCATWGEVGSYNDCVTMGNGVCNGGSCVSDNPQAPTAGACAQLGCTDVCDCPDPALSGLEGGTLVCDTLTGDMQNGCFFDCSGGAACPDGMNCLGGFFCAWGGGGIEPWGDCVNVPPGTACEEGVCAVDNTTTPTAGACASPCMSAADCPPPPEGGAAPACGNFGGGNMFCILPCTGGCPDGMECISNTLCAWPVSEGAGFGDCVDPLPNDECLDSETCFTDNAGNPTHGFCSADCANVGECPDAPATGDAPVACGDIGGGNTCYLDCSGAGECPDNMECINDDYCAFPVIEPSLFEDFEGGAIPGTWTLINNDGLTINPMNPLPFGNAAFIVVADPAGSQVAAGTSWYQPAGTADDWLITPQVTLGAGSILGFQARSADGGFPDNYEVRISTTGTTIANFMANAPLLTVTPESATYVARQIDLAAAGYTDQDVYIAFHLTTNDGTALFVDNVFVGE